MLNYFFKPSFTRLFKKLEPHKKRQVIEAINGLKELLGAGRNSEGLGLKRLSRDIWEIRSSLKDRMLFTYSKNVVIFILVGNHDDIAKYLKNG